MTQPAKARSQGTRRSGVGTGTTSLLMIFTVLCFATLAMLGLSTATSSERIQSRGIEGARGVAVAKGQAAEAVAALDEKLTELRAKNRSEDDYFEEAFNAAEALGWTVDREAQTIALATPIDTENDLLTQLRLLGKEEDARYELVQQISRPAAGWKPEAGGQVWLP